MSKEIVQEEAAHFLQARIDELSTRLILDSVGATLPGDLRLLSEAAQQSGCLETARAALILAEEAGHFRAGEERGSEDRVRQGLSALLKVLEAENGKTHLLSPEAAPVQNPPVVTNSLAEDPELVGDFILESREHLISIENQMLVLEQTPGAVDAIHAVFRGFHTIKGLAGFLEFTSIQIMAHEVETLLDLARNEKLSITPAAVDVILESTDYLKEAIDA